MPNPINSVTLDIERYEELRIIERAHLSNAVMKITIDRGRKMLAIIEPNVEIKILNNKLIQLRDELKVAIDLNHNYNSEFRDIKRNNDELNETLERLSKSSSREFRRWKRKNK